MMPSHQRTADILGDADRFPVIEDREVLMDVKHVAFHLIAADAGDGTAGRNGRQRREPDGSRTHEDANDYEHGGAVLGG